MKEKKKNYTHFCLLWPLFLCPPSFIYYFFHFVCFFWEVSYLKWWLLGGWLFGRHKFIKINSCGISNACSFLFFFFFLFFSFAFCCKTENVWNYAIYVNYFWLQIIIITTTVSSCCYWCYCCYCCIIEEIVKKK